MIVHLPTDLLRILRSVGTASYRRPRVLGALGVAACVLVVGPHAGARPESEATAASALAADDELSTAIRENNADAIRRWLDDGWGVVATSGAINEGASIFPDGVKTGVLVRKTFETSEDRVRLYGSVALVTTKVKTSGTFAGKPFDVVERQTDVWLLRDDGWKCVFTHETQISSKSS